MLQPDITLNANGINLKGIRLTPQIIAAGGDHSLVVTNQNKAYSWGDNDNGQLGDNHRPDDSYAPIELNLSETVSIAAGLNHSLALQKNGTVWGWGRNYSSQLGLNKANKELAIPTQIPNLTHVTAIAAGKQHSLALKEDGTVWVWGDNKYGQLGYPPTAKIEVSATPVQIAGLSDIVAITSGIYHMLALKADGSVWMWGRNNHGQQGDGNKGSTGAFQAIPKPIQALKNITAIATRGYHCLAVNNLGEVFGWGFNDYGQLGANAKKTQATPAIIDGLVDITALSAGRKHNTALKADGTVWTWGHNIDGQLGNGTYTDSKTPVQVKNLADIAAISAGDDHNLAVKKDGTVWTWGDNDNGQLGNANKATDNRNLPQEVKGLLLDSTQTAKVPDYQFAQQQLTTTSDVVTFTIGNAGNSDLYLADTNKVSISNSSDFILTDASEKVLKPTDTITFTIAFKPSTLGKHQTKVSILSNDPNDNPLTFTITGEGIPKVIPKPKLIIVPAPADGRTWDFGDVNVESAKVIELTLKNQGKQPLPLTNDIIQSAKVAPFIVTGLPKQIEPNSEIQFSLKFHPLTGGQKHAEFTIKTTPDGPSFDYQLLGRGAGAEIAINQGDINVPTTGFQHAFEQVKVGQQTQALPFTIENHGGDNLQLTGSPTVQITGSDANSFVIETLPDAVIKPNESQHFTVRFKPTSAGDKVATLIITSNDSDEGTCQIELKGNAKPTVQVQKGHQLSAWYQGANNVIGLIRNGTRFRASLSDRWNNTSGMQDTVALGGCGYSVKNDGTVWYGIAPAKQVQGISDVALVDASQTHILFLKKDGTVYSQAAHNAHYLTDLQGVISTNAFTSPEPVLIAGLDGVVNIAAGGGFSMALKEDGTVWTWGYNRSGELGNGQTWTPSANPIQVPNLTGVIHICAGDLVNEIKVSNGGNPAFAVRNDGTVWAWGAPGRGSFANGATSTYARNTPAQLPGLTGVKMVAINGEGGCLGLTNTGQVWAWGCNNLSSIYPGTQYWMRTISPMLVPGLNGIVDIATSMCFSLALDSAGRTRNWGCSINRGRRNVTPRPVAVW